jgi:hypothetical protein
MLEVVFFAACVIEVLVEFEPELLVRGPRWNLSPSL